MKDIYYAPASETAVLSCESGVLGASGDHGSTWESGAIGGIDNGSSYSDTDFD